MSFDFIIIGSGLAGLSSALVAKDYGSVIIITKGKLSDCATNLAQGGIAVVIEDSDSFTNHINDTLIAGAYHNNKKAVEYVVKNGLNAINWLVEKGVQFARIDGKLSPTREAAHSHYRVLHATDFTGREIEKTLIRKVRKEKNIDVWENCFVADLLVENEVCYGVKVIGQSSKSASSADKLISSDLYSKVVILTTGGLGQLYQWTTNPEVATGDGVALAYRAGAKVKDMEFIQFHPTALKDGKSPLFLLSEALRGEGAYLIKIKDQKLKIKNTDKKLKIKETGERFMRDYDKRLELAPRDVVARAIYEEQQKGYEVFLDIRHKGKEFLEKRFPNISLELKRRGFELSETLIPVTPAAHYSCGGVEVDLFGRTNIKNLFSFGEVSCSGVHGANRLASNSLLEAVVFPLQIGKVLTDTVCHSEHIRQAQCKRVEESLTDVRKYKQIVRSFISLRMTKIKKELQHLMWEKVGIVRTRKDLKKAEKILGVWEEELGKMNCVNKEYLELRNMIQAAKLIVKACVKRPQNLGAHFMV